MVRGKDIALRVRILSRDSCMNNDTSVRNQELDACTCVREVRAKLKPWAGRQAGDETRLPMTALTQEITDPHTHK